jgi:two-component system sensor histidine kinase BaeS
MTKERISIVKNEAERLVELVKQLDAYAKARVPNTSVSELVPLQSFCQEVIGQFEFELKKQKIHVGLDIAPDDTVRANPAALRQIFVNLVQNTLRYAEASEIVIKADAQRISFSDNGKGVPSESLTHLFERFYRVDTSRSRDTGGLGLGLAIVRELVESQGWTITVEVGKPGLTFIMDRGHATRTLS